MRSWIPITAGVALAQLAMAAPIAFQEATVTEAVNQVDVLSGASRRSARTSDRVRGNEIVRTGQRSRAELRFPDNTIARVGANAAFAFRTDTRGLELQKGSVLFHSPKGLGGGQIRTAAATASVLGTTIIVCATPEGGFKVLVLEGKAKVQTPNGRSLVLRAGEMTFILARNGNISPALTFRLNHQVQDAKLVNGFAAALPSLAKIGDAVKRQEGLIRRGIMDPTRLLIGRLRDDENLELLDPNSAPQNTDPLRRLDNPAARELFLALLHRYHVMLNRPGLVDDRPLDPRHIVHPAELDSPIAFEAFLLALSDAGFRPRPPSGEGPGVNIIDAPDFAFAPLQAAFVARGIAFNDATINLSHFRAAGIFTFLSLADILIQGNLEVGGLRGIVDFHARDVIHFPSGSSIASLHPGVSMVFASGGPLLLDDVSFDLPLGSLALASARDIDLLDVTANAGKSIRVNSRNSVHLTDANLSSAGPILLNSRGAMDLSGGSLDAGTTPSPNLLRLTAGSRLDISGTALLAQNIRLQAITIALRDVNFPPGSDVLLRSGNGMLAPNPNNLTLNGGVALPGYVNYIDNVRYGGSLLYGQHPNISIQKINP